MIIQKCYSLGEDADKKKDLKPLDVELTLGKNSRGLLVIYLSTGKHKYLEVEYDMCCGKNRRLVLRDSMEEWEGHNEYELYQSIHYWFVPENDEEEKLIDGLGLVIPLKYEYKIVVVPWEDTMYFENFLTYKEQEITHPYGLFDL